MQVEPPAPRRTPYGGRLLGVAQASLSAFALYLGTLRIFAGSNPLTPSFWLALALLVLLPIGLGALVDARQKGPPRFRMAHEWRLFWAAFVAVGCVAIFRQAAMPLSWSFVGFAVWFVLMMFVDRVGGGLRQLIAIVLIERRRRRWESIRVIEQEEGTTVFESGGQMRVAKTDLWLNPGLFRVRMRAEHIGEGPLRSMERMKIEEAEPDEERQHNRADLWTSLLVIVSGFWSLMIPASILIGDELTRVNNEAFIG